MLEDLEARSLLSAAPGDVGPDAVVRFPAGIAAAPIVVDLNRDGADDVLIAGNRRLQAFLNDGNGSFTATRELVLPGQVGKIATGEFLAAGQTSIAALGTVANGQGGASGALRLIRFDAGRSRLVVVDRRAVNVLSDVLITGANVAGDGLDEIVFAGTKYDRAGGSASVHVHGARVVGGVLTELSSRRPLSVTTEPLRRFDGVLTALAAGDFSGDGFEDVALGVYSARNATGSLIALRARPSWPQAFTAGTPLAAAYTSFTAIAFGQVAGDARADLVLTYARRVDAEDARIVSDVQGVMVLTRTGVAGWSAPQDAGAALATIPGEVQPLAPDRATILSTSDLNGDGVADFVVQKRLEWSRSFPPRQSVYYKTTTVQVYLSVGGTWSERTAWSRNFADGNVFTPETRFGSEPPVFAGLIRLRASDTESRLVGSVGRDVLTGMTLGELAGTITT